MFNYDPQKQYPKETESRVVIRFQDCDPLRHLNNAKYFDYFFNAREDQVPKLYGLEIIDLIRVYKAVSTPFFEPLINWNLKMGISLV
jgi:acyl-CoA thioester hydrolase